MPRGKILLSKVGLDGHDRGVKTVASLLRDAGFEVIYLGMFRTPPEIAEAALQEAVDVVGVSCLSGEHLTFTPKILRELEEREIGEIPLVLGGVIPVEDMGPLKEMGVRAVFRAGSLVSEMAETLEDLIGKQEGNGRWKPAPQ